MKIISLVSAVFRREPNLLELSDGVTVVGDIHGQFYDLLHLLEMGGSPESEKYLFLGDYVDRGSFSIEVLILIFCMKLCFPNTVHCIRGNHECR
jgi:serine/threonine-protein phosphatase 2B catalytic subunit